MEYQITGSDINMIISYCWDLLANEKLVVFDYGWDRDLVLHIFKDEGYNPEDDEDAWNMVTISVFKDGKCIEDIEDTYVSDGSLKRELTRLLPL